MDDWPSPAIAPEVRGRHPDFRALSIAVRGLDTDLDSTLPALWLAEACDDATTPDWAEDHFDSWREAFRSFGAKPRKTPSSGEALRRRAAAGGSLRSGNALVDLYNAVSLRFALPVGGEDWDSYVGHPRLVVTAGGERFDTTGNGVSRTEIVPAGEIAWRDDLGVTCRRWNWRQGSRTRLNGASRNAWFMLEALAPMSDEALRAAGAALADGLLALSPGCEIRVEMIGQDVSANEALTHARSVR